MLSLVFFDHIEWKTRNRPRWHGRTKDLTAALFFRSVDGISVVYECLGYARLAAKARIFSLLLQAKAVLLNARGLDTAADVYFNDVLVLKARNQFVPYLVALKSWKLGKNRLRIEFKSPIAYAQQQAEAYQVRLLCTFLAKKKCIIGWSCEKCCVWWGISLKTFQIRFLGIRSHIAEPD